MASRRMKKILILLCLCLCFMPHSVQATTTADAIEAISPDKDCTLEISYRYEGVAVNNVSVNLYHVGSVSADLKYATTESFGKSGVDFNGVQTAAEWDVICSTLESYIVSNVVTPTINKITDSAGRIEFKSLTPGLYLATSKLLSQNNQQPMFQPVIVALPGLDGNGSWQYNITVSPKPAVLPPGEETMQLKVLKLWKDEGQKAKRPQQIEVEIFRDGESYDVITLSEENNWTYCWESPADNTSWTIAEKKVPDRYSATVEKRGGTFVLTNILPKDNDIQNSAPKTGDTAHMLLYAVIMLVSGTVMMLIGVSRKRERV